MEAVGLNKEVEEFEKEHDVYDFSRITGKDPFDFEKHKNDPPRRGSKFPPESHTATSHRACCGLWTLRSLAHREKSPALL